MVVFFPTPRIFNLGPRKVGLSPGQAILAGAKFPWRGGGDSKFETCFQKSNEFCTIKQQLGLSAHF